MNTAASSQSSSVKEDLRRLVGRVLSFSLGKENYGVDILCIQEVIGFIEPIPVPKSSRFLRGVINLRGMVIPVLDLRESFGLESTEYDRRSCIIVIQGELSPTMTPVGIVVDRVLDVVALKHEHLQSVPNFGTTLDTACLVGLARISDQTINLIDMRKVIDKCSEAVICGTRAEVKI
jgi:purine-binding chemotaxis protein CheW